ncbi:translation initiation factor IF-2 [candidate division WWE3 bacterium]|nr:translation initiation factor IF-2 [candidate division WWE3 bacterium]
MLNYRRPPIVVVMGHVDHGKTSILDKIRNTQIQQKEAGGITQSIGAYQATYNGDVITFIDTPGHEAFTQMRSRGGQIADIIVLVVAADDGVMPQTKEAIQHAKFSGARIIVAINKIDLVGANLNKVKKQLSDNGILIEEYAGDVPVVLTSATTGAGIDDLLKQIVTSSKQLDLQVSDEKNDFIAKIVESYLDNRRGPIANMIVISGRLAVRDVVLTDQHVAKVRSMRDWLGVEVKEVLPGTPVELLGFSAVPTVGAEIRIAENIKDAEKLVAEKQRDIKNFTQLSAQDRIRRAFFEPQVREIPVIIKASSQGSLEALIESVNLLSNEQVRIKVLSQSVGSISENDIVSAIPMKAFVIGFGVGVEKNAETLAIKERIICRRYEIIYRLLEELQEVIGMEIEDLIPQPTGKAKVKQLFELTNGQVVAGSEVTEGYLKKGSKVSIVRPYGENIEGKIASLKKNKDDVGQVKRGEECGILLEGDIQILVGDIIEAFK